MDMGVTTGWFPFTLFHEWVVFMVIITDWARKNGFSHVMRKDQGRTAIVYWARHEASQKDVALKVVHEKNRRPNSIEREAILLERLNVIGVGPILYAFDLENRLLVMEWVNGTSFREWVLDSKPSQKQLLFVINELLLQARVLDTEKIDHSQLAGRGQNILVRKAGKSFEPVLIDFEKASTIRRCHNFSQLASFLYYSPTGVVACKLKERLGSHWFDSLSFNQPSSVRFPNP